MYTIKSRHFKIHTRTQFQNTKALERDEIPHFYIPCAHILQRNEHWCFVILLDHPSHPSPKNNHHEILWQNFHYQLQEGINCIQTMRYASRILFNNWLCIIKDFVQQLVVYKWKVVMHEDKIIQPLLFQVVSLLHVNAFKDRQIMLTL